MRPFRVLLPSLLLVACGAPSQGPFFDDQRYLVFGVEPDAEAAALVERFEAAGRKLLLRVRGHHFTALGFDDGNGHAAAVRVITSRGIELALDPPPGDGLHDPVAYRLLAAPIEGTQDADGDGFEELFVERLVGGAREGCIEPYRVRDAGFVDPVPVELAELQGLGCVEDLRDVDSDGRVEPWLVLRASPIDPAAALSVGLPLVADRHRFVARPAQPPAVSALVSQRTARELTLADARVAGDAGRAYRAALELELIARLSGVAKAERAKALQAALEGVAVDPARLSAALARLRPPPAPAPAPAASERTPAKAGK